MNIAIQLVRAQHRILSIMHPRSAVNSAGKVFFTPRRHQQKAWEDAAEKQGQRISLDKGVSAIRWGQGKSILMMHGWEGRATQMAGFIDPLVQRGYQIIALDAPAHGLSKGVTAHPRKFVEAMFLAEQTFGPFYAVIGHSMGAGSAVYAISQGLNANKLVVISGPANFKTVSRRFAQFIGLNKRAEQGFINHVEQTVGIPFDDINLAKNALSVNVPALVIHDKDDIEIPIGDGQAVSEALPQARFMQTKGYGHRKIMRADEVIQQVAEFIDDW